MLHVTNGDSAVAGIREARAEGEILPWRDVLHEGPVPAGLPLPELSEVRARFIAGQGWAPPDEVRRSFAERDEALTRSAGHGEVVLWFEHDLYDQLQLIQLLDWFSDRRPGAARLTLVQAGEYLGSAAPERLRELYEIRQAVTPDQLALGRRAWRAFRSPDPTEVETFLGEDSSALPYLAAALRRHLEQFPSSANGLSRSEQQGLEAVAAGRTALADAYVASHHEREEPVFLGDDIFAAYLERLSTAPHPLLRFVDGTPVRLPRTPAEEPHFWQRELSLTDTGRAVLEGRADHVRLNGIDHCLGGVHLRPDSLWRWDSAQNRLIRG